MQIFDELKVRGVEDVLFICMDGVSGLEDGAEAIFKDVVVQLCIVHLVRNSIKYVPSKDYKKFTQSLKKFTEHQALTDAEKHLNSFVRSGHNIPEQLMCGNEISTMSSSFSIMAVPFVRLCIQPMRLKASIRAFARSPKKVLFQTKMHCSNCSISELPSFTKNGTEARYKTGQWSEINCLQMKKSVPVSKNTST